MMPNSFIPENFDVPRFFDTEYFHFRTLEGEVATLDFDAVMSSQKRLQGIFGPESDWPKAGMTLEDNRQSLNVHQQEFEARTAFAYSVFNNSKNKCLGSVYIDPSRSSNYDCEVYLWIRDDSFSLDNELYQTVLNWLHQRWPFSTIAFPGRALSWEAWEIELNSSQQ